MQVQRPVAQVPNAAQKKKFSLKWYHFAGGAAALLVIIIIIAAIFGSGTSTPASSPSGGTVVDYSLDGNITETASKTKTVMIYVCGSTLESKDGSASYDISEMMNSGVDAQKNNILIYTGGAKRWEISLIPTDKNCIYRYNGTEFELVKELPQKDMADSSTLSEFVSFGLNNYSTDEYALILWNHGSGPIFGYGYDENTQGIMSMPALSQALKSAGLGSGKKLEFIGFDACLMSSVETAWTVKDYANYMVASEETEPGWGWDYSFLKYLDNYDSGDKIGKMIVDTYFHTGNEYFNINSECYTDLTLSCVDLSKISNLETSINSLFKEVDSNILSGYYPQISRYRCNTKAFGKFSTDTEYDLIDLGHMMSFVSADYADKANAVSKNLGDAVVYSKSNVANASGLSIYHPYDNKDLLSYFLTEHKKIGFAADYEKYIDDFGGILESPGSNAWKSIRSIPGSASRKGSNNELSFKLNDEQVKNYASSSYYILKKMEGDEYLFVFGGYDTTLSPDGTLSASYNNKAVYSVDDKTNVASDDPITMYQVRDNSSETRYVVPSMFWYFADELSSSTITPVQWQLKLEDGKPRLLGAYELTDEGSNVAQKKLLDYKDFTIIEFSFSTRKLTKDADGNTLPYFQWQGTGKFYGNQYEVADGFHLEARELQNKNDMYCMFVVKDINGNSYASDLFELP